MLMHSNEVMRTAGRAALMMLLCAAGLMGGCKGCEPASTARGTAIGSDTIDSSASRPKPTTPSTETAAMRDMKPTTPARPASLPGQAAIKPLELSDAEWAKKLTDEQFAVLREKGTERAFTGKYWRTKPRAEQSKDQSIYKCAACGLELFRADSKFDSGCGWPSFDKMIQVGTVLEVEDRSYGMIRTEVICARCKGHLGHLFDDGPTETGLRYCINSVSIIKEEAGQAAETKPAAAPDGNEKK